MKALDTSVIVDHLRGFPPAVELLQGLVASGEEIVASEIVRFELLDAELLTTNVRHFPMLEGLEPPY